MPGVLRGWSDGLLLVHPKVDRHIHEVFGPFAIKRLGWKGRYEVAETHIRHACVTGRDIRPLLWMGTGSLGGYEHLPEWWMLLADTDIADLSARKPSSPRPNGGVWAIETRGLNMEVISEGLGRLRLWAVYYCHPDLAQWAIAQGAVVLVAGAQKELNSPMIGRMPAAVRQWAGHAKIAVYDRGILLTSLNGSCRPIRREFSLFVPGDPMRHEFIREFLRIAPHLPKIRDPRMDLVTSVHLMRSLGSVPCFASMAAT